MRVRRSPCEPTAAQREQHEAEGHTNYRSWCWACVSARGRSGPHFAGSGDPEQAAKISFDFCYLAPRHEESSPILVSVVNLTGKVSAHVLPSKGVTPFNIDLFAKLLQRANFTDLEVQTDGEPAMTSLRDRGMALERTRYGINLTLLGTVEYDHQGNGAVEVAVREVKAQSRTLKIALEGKLGVELPSDSGILVWLVTFAADMITRCRVGRDGKTAWMRMRHKAYDKSFPLFGERVWWMPVQDRAMTGS